MEEHPRDRLIASHIASITSRGERDAERLCSAILRRCWPAGAGDRREPGALEWVRRWGPWRVGPMALACDCATGRCAICN